MRALLRVCVSVRWQVILLLYAAELLYNFYSAFHSDLIVILGFIILFINSLLCANKMIKNIPRRASFLALILIRLSVLC